MSTPGKGARAEPTYYDTGWGMIFATAMLGLVAIFVDAYALLKRLWRAFMERMVWVLLLAAALFVYFLMLVAGSIQLHTFY